MKFNEVYQEMVELQKMYAKAMNTISTLEKKVARLEKENVRLKEEIERMKKETQNEIEKLKKGT